MSTEEKSAVKQSVLNFIYQNPVRPDMSPRLDYRSSLFLNKLSFIPSMAILLIVTLLVGGGVAIGAEKALPGDPLYGIKVGFNEEVRGALAISSEAKADWEVKRAERRLEEAEHLASNGTLDTEVRAIIEANFKAHSERVRNRIADFENKEDFDAAVDVSSNFEVSLRAHEKILAELLEQETDDDLKVEIKPIKTKVGSEAKIARKSREDNEQKVSAKVRVDIKASAEGKLRAAENKIAESQKYIENLNINEEAKIQLRAKVKAAEDLVVEAKVKMDARAYGDAFILLQRAIRTLQEVKLITDANQEFKFQVELNGDSHDDNDDNDEDDEIEGEIEINLDHGGSRKSGELRANIGL